MDIKDYAQMMRYLTRPRDVVPDPRPMDQEPRNMYANGQLVQNTVDGSRPGYNGDNRFSTPIKTNTADFKDRKGRETKAQLNDRYKINFKKLKDIPSEFSGIQYYKTKADATQALKDKQTYIKKTAEKKQTARNELKPESEPNFFERRVGPLESVEGQPNIKKITYEIVEGSKNQAEDKIKRTGKFVEKYVARIINTTKEKGKKQRGAKGQPVDVKYEQVLSSPPSEDINDAIRARDEFRVKNPEKIPGTQKDFQDKLKKLWDNPKIKNIFNTSTPSEEEIKIVQNILGNNTTERQAQNALAQLGDVLSPTGSRSVPGINKIDPMKADAFYDFHKGKKIAQEVEGIKLGESVGEKSTERLRQDIQRELPFEGGAETYSADEALGRSTSYRLGSKPYGIFGQVIDGRVNSGDKMRWDSRKGALEEGVQKAIRGEGDLTVKQAIDKFNSEATAAEKKFNANKSRGFKKVTIPRIAKAPPSQTIANKTAYKKYKKYFDKNFKELGYSFRIPKDLLPLPDIAKGLKDKKSPIYKKYFKDLKKAAGNIIDNVNQYDEKQLFEKLQKSPKFDLFKKILPRLVSNDDFSEKRYASANNIMSDATYVDDMTEEETFGKKNPITTGIAGSTAVGGTMLAQKPVRTAARKLLGTLGTNLAALPLMGHTIYGNVKNKGQNIVDAVVDPFVGAEFLLPGIFRENVDKITKNPKLKQLLTLGKLGRYMNPAGVGILGLDAVHQVGKLGYEDQQRFNALSPREQQSERAEQEKFAQSVEGAAEGGIMRLKKND